MYTTMGPWTIQTVRPENPPSLLNVRLAAVAREVERHAERLLVYGPAVAELDFEVLTEALEHAAQHWVGVVQALTPREQELLRATPRIIRWGLA